MLARSNLCLFLSLSLCWLVVFGLFWGLGSVMLFCGVAEWQGRISGYLAFLKCVSSMVLSGLFYCWTYNFPVRGFEKHTHGVLKNNPT